MENLMRKYALQNALLHKGKANPGAVIGKVLAEQPDLKSQMKTLAKDIQEIVKEVNALSPEEQKKELQTLAPELLEKKEHKQHDIFAFLKLPQEEKIVTCFPPEPSKYPHIGHAKAILLNYELAKRHNGKFILRFEDTNPQLAQTELYEEHKKSYEWLGIEPDEVCYASDYMKDFYSYAEQLIDKGHAYLCTLSPEEMKTHRFKGTENSCRSQSVEENKKLWKDFFTAPQGSMTLCLKGEMNSKNTALRDPTLMRIIEKDHARTGKQYRVWPTYDFENSVMDCLQGITHRLRTKEFELRNELQRKIQSLLGFPPTTIYEFARFNLKGTESSGRIIREHVESGSLLGWDDPTLTTLAALKRRGFTPQAIKSFVLSTGITKAEATYTWDDLIKHNRRVLDDQADRFFFIHDPQEILIENAPEQEVSLKRNPHTDDIRTFTTNTVFYLAKNDVDQLQDGKLYRLMDCLNFTKNQETYSFVSTSVEDYKKKGEKIIHWLPKSEDLLNVTVLLPDKKQSKGLGESTLQGLKQGDIIQFERFGFCRLDNKEGNELSFWFTHP